MAEDGKRTLKQELDDYAQASRRSNMLMAAAVIFTGIYSLTAYLAFNSDGSDFFGEGMAAEDLQFAAFYGSTMAGVSALAVVLSLFKMRAAAVLLWIPVALYWIDLALVVVSGTFPGIPWLPGIATFLAFRGTGGVFHYQRLLKEERETKTRTPVEAFD